MIAQVPALAAEKLEEGPAFRMPAPPQIIGQLSKSRDPFGQIRKLIFDTVHYIVHSKSLSTTFSSNDIFSYFKEDPDADGLKCIDIESFLARRNHS
jgi:hypothetical protein